MTTQSGLTEKRKLESVTSDESLQGGPNQKLIKRSSAEQVSDIFFQKHSPTSERDEEEDDDDDDNDDDFSEMNDIHHKNPSNQSYQQEQRPDQQQQKGQEQPQPQLPPQRKKPGRKPNPASPALRKAQNRAAQRAFRERKERHLRDLEDTIKDLRERNEKYHSVITHLESENTYWKKVAIYFECILNKINGNNDATTKLKNHFSLTSRSTATPFLFNGGRTAVGQINPSFGLEAMQMRQPSLSHQVPTAQQLQNNCLDLLQTSMGVNCDALNFNDITPTSNVLASSPNGSATVSTTSVSAASSPLSPESVIAESISPSSTFLVEEFAREMTIADMKPFINPTPGIQISHEPSYVSSNVYNSSITSMYKAAIRSSSSSSSRSNSTSSTVSVASPNNDDSITSANTSSFMDEAVYNNNNNDLFLDYLDDQGLDEFSNFELDNTDVIPNITDKGLSKEEQQILRLSRKMGQSVVAPVIPKVKYPLTEEQMYYLTVEHDRRIDMIPCLHLRARMIQYQDQYDLYELIELLIEQAKCHGEPSDPDSWELPDEFFDRYDVLVFQQCRIKSNLYKQFGHLPKDFLIT